MCFARFSQGLFLPDSVDLSCGGCDDCSRERCGKVHQVLVQNQTAFSELGNHKRIDLDIDLDFGGIGRSSDLCGMWCSDGFRCCDSDRDRVQSIFGWRTSPLHEFENVSNSFRIRESILELDSKMFARLFQSRIHICNVFCVLTG